jgi:DNA-binding response OmpR family regulator
MSAPYETSPGYRPCLVLAHADAGYAATAARAFRRRGWDVYLARTGPEARRLVRMLAADLVVLHTNLDGESGWLSCAKLVAERPLLEVVLVADAPTHLAHRFAAFAGADSLVDGRAGPAALVAEVEGTPLPAAG